MTDRSCDILVVGAGPAGSIAARELARRGVRVLLVDRCRFPRTKVCGCCVGGGAVAALHAMGLELTADVAAPTTRVFRLHAHGRSVTAAIDSGFSMSRSAFDAALMRAAVEAGVEFRDGVSAACDAGGVMLQSVHGRQRIAPALTIAADGLAGSFLRDPGAQVARRSRMGVSAMLDRSLSDLEPGVITMACGAGGYVGTVRVESGLLNIAAALDPALVKRHGAPSAAVASILADAGCPVPRGLNEATWRGVGLLTRRRFRLGSTRVLCVGDSAGYVEPFTGEGIAWAIASAQAVVPFALEALSHWDDAIVDRWTQHHHAMLRGRQRACRALTAALRWRLLRLAMLGTMTRMPSVARHFIASLHRPLAIPTRGVSWAC